MTKTQEVKMKKPMRLITLIFLLSGFLTSGALTPPADILEARELCDQTDLHPVEGLWLCPEDDITLLIMRDNASEHRYSIVVVESADCSLSNGMEIGSLTISPDPNKFKLKLFTRIKKGILSSPCEAAATYSAANESMRIEKPSLKISFQPGRLLPYFWRTVRVKVNNPAEKVPEGMIKVYPTFDNNNNSIKRNPRYL